MGWLFLIVLLLAAIGVLGFVVKLTLVLMLLILLAVATVVTIGWFSFKAWAREAQRQTSPRPDRSPSGGTYEARGWIRRDRRELPPPDGSS